MDIWLTFVTVSSVRGKPADAQAAQQIENELTLQAGRTGQPGIDPAAEHLHGDHIRIRQSFPHVSAWQAVMLSGESLRRTVRDGDIVSIETVKLADWLQRGGR
ncbi:hypothetical protein ACWEP4_44545 [Streptomyces sp. NPDC004227]